MNKILLIILSNTMNVEYKENIKCIKEKIINNFDNIDVCLVSSYDDYHNYDDIIDIKYKLKCKDRQFIKMVEVFKFLNNNNTSYDWYIKVRPDLLVLDNIDKSFLSSCDENSLNARIRFYIGPELNIKYGASHITNDAWCKSWIYNHSLLTIAPDDQIYIFHNNIANKCFEPIIYSNISNEVIDYYYFHCNTGWTLNKIYTHNIIESGLKTQLEWFFRDILFLRNIKINPFGFNIIFRNLQSNDLIINKPNLFLQY